MVYATLRMGLVPLLNASAAAQPVSVGECVSYRTHTVVYSVSLVVSCMR